MSEESEFMTLGSTNCEQTPKSVNQPKHFSRSDTVVLDDEEDDGINLKRIKLNFKDVKKEKVNPILI